MVHFYDSIPEKLLPWILAQKIFWVATAPLNSEGHINVSPKGVYGTFHITNPNQVWYEDLSGSGVETISHIRENRRITIMFTAFEGAPNIVRLFGKGTVHEFGTPEYNALIMPKNRIPGSRSVIVVDVYQVSTSCGYAVPYFAYTSERTTLNQKAAMKEAVDEDAEATADDPIACRPDDGLKSYWEKNNTKSLDGLTGLRSAYTASFRLTGYTAKESPERTGSVTAQACTRLRATIVSETGDIRLLIAFVLGGLATSICFGLLA